MPAVPTVTAGRVVTLTAFTDPASTSPRSTMTAGLTATTPLVDGERDNRAGRGPHKGLHDVVDVVDAGNLVDGDLDGEQDDEDGDADVGREDVVRSVSVTRFVARSARARTRSGM